MLFNTLNILHDSQLLSYYIAITLSYYMIAQSQLLSGQSQRNREP